MSEDVWEQSVGLWLTRDRGIFVSPSFHLGEDGRWGACLDFLALDFDSRTIWAVEVTTSPGASAIKAKAKEFDAEYKHRILDALEQRGVKLGEGGPEWTVGLWAFVRKDYLEPIRDVLEACVGRVCVTAIEEVAFPWDYWDKRFR